MQCPYCGSDKLKVLDTTDIKNGIRRRRECQTCGERFTTYERSLATAPVLIKENGNREEFDRDKLKRGIWNACAKRPIPAAEIDRLTMRIEAYLQSLGRSEVSSRVVGDMVVEGLKNLDPIAYIRYAIVYLGLDDLESVRSEIDKLLAEQADTFDTPKPGKPTIEAPGLASNDAVASAQAEPEPQPAVGETTGLIQHRRDKTAKSLAVQHAVPSEP
ncbi:MAG: transcriptional regulator NrdR [Chloroflexota bacterium]